MSYIDGFVLAVPNASKQDFIEHAREMDAVFIQHGALRVIEAWADDVPKGTTTDFYMAVKANDEEGVVFSWIEWPDKATRDAAMAKVMADPKFQPGVNPMPFDGKRMIFGGFSPLVDLSK